MENNQGHKKECCENWKCDCIHHYKREPNAIIPICSCHSPSNKERLTCGNCECRNSPDQDTECTDSSCQCHSPTERKKDGWEEFDELVYDFVRTINDGRELSHPRFVGITKLHNYLAHLLTTEREKTAATIDKYLTLCAQVYNTSKTQDYKAIVLDIQTHIRSLTNQKPQI